MDRERKLLYTVAILAPLVEGLMFATVYQPRLPAVTEAIAETRACQEQLIRAWARCSPRHDSDKCI